MSTATDSRLTLTSQQLASYEKDGYLIVPRLFNDEQVERTRRYFDDLAERKEPVPGHWIPDPSSGEIGKNDPLARYPRVLHPHRFDEGSKRMMLEPRVGDVLAQLLGEEAVACQSMFYFKAPGSRGQALHQDNFYLEVTPGSCIAAWTAIDRVDTENGGLMVVPGTHKLGMICPEQADLQKSFTTHLVNPPKGMKAIPAEMEPGDVLFFNGSLIHGSGPNRSKDRWRRSFICHYMPRSSHTVAKFYLPILGFDGSEIAYQASTGGGPCGYADDFVKPVTYH